MKNSFRIGTRGSKLALWQANHVGALLLDSFPALQTDIVVIKTTGDNMLNSPLSEIGGKGVFVKEIEEALLSEKIDIAVHSMKDVPSELPSGLEIGAVVSREDPRDALVSKNGLTLEQLPKGSRVGTGSLRRASQILHNFPELKIEPIRGNVDTRINKLREGNNYDAIVLAAAGLNRMGLEHEITEIISEDIMVPAPGQGIVAIESRIDDNETKGFLEKIVHKATNYQARAERAFLQTLGGDCNVPVGCNSSLDGSELKVLGVLCSPDGRNLIRKESSGQKEMTEELGRRLASMILEDGGREILKQLTLN